MEQQTNQHIIHSDEKELTLKEIILLVQEYSKELLSNWLLIACFVIPITAYLVWGSLSPELTYLGSITFMVNEDKGENMSNVAGLLSSFRIGSKLDDENALEKVLQLFRSRRIVENTIFQKIIIDGKDDYIANHIVDIYSYPRLLGPYRKFGMSQRQWLDEMEKLDGFRFQSDSSIHFNKEGQIMMQVLYDWVVGNPDLGIGSMVGSTIDEKTGIMNISLTTIDEALTLKMVMKLYDELSDFYIEKTIEKQLKIFEIMEFKRDSIQAELMAADRQLAEFEDSNRSLVWVRGELKRTRLERDVRILEIMYGEVIRKLEVADFALRRKRPYVEIIDEPVSPINPSGASVISALIIGLLIGGGLSAGFVIVRKIIRDAMSSN